MPPESQNYAPQVTSGSGFGLKSVLGIIIAIVVIGAGSYYFYFQNSSSTSQMNTYKNSGSLTCRDLLPDNKFKEITGISDFQLIEEGRDRAVEGLNMLPGYEGAGNLVVDAGIGQIVCGYAVTAKSKESASYAGAVAGDVTYTVVWGGDAPNGVAFNNGRKLDSQTITGEFNGETITVPPDPEVSIDIPGVGAAAYFKGGLLQILSSNKNYYIGFISGKDLNNSREIQKNLAKVIDSNLP